MDTKYEVARIKAAEASKTFRAVQEAYRAAKLTDAEYLAARAEYDKSTVEFDAAFLAAESRFQEAI